MSKKLVKTVLVVCLLVLIIGAIVVSIQQRRSKQPSNNEGPTRSLQSEPTYDISVKSMEELNKNYPDPNKRLIEYTAAAGTLAQIGKNEEAFKYYEEANKIQSVDSSKKQQSNYSAYSLAKRINDTNHEKEYADILGNKIKDMETTLNVQE